MTMQPLTITTMIWATISLGSLSERFLEPLKVDRQLETMEFQTLVNPYKDRLKLSLVGVDGNITTIIFIVIVPGIDGP